MGLKRKRLKNTTTSDFSSSTQRLGRKKLSKWNEVTLDIRQTTIKVPEQKAITHYGIKGSIITSHNLTLDELLSQISHHNSNVRRDAICGIQELIEKFPEHITPCIGRILQALLKCCYDNDVIVRMRYRELLDKILTLLSQNSLSSSSNVSRLDPFLHHLGLQIQACLTHRDTLIRSESFLLIEIMLKYTNDQRTCQWIPHCLSSSKSLQTSLNQSIDNYDSFRDDTVSLVIKLYEQCQRNLMLENGIESLGQLYRVSRIALHLLELTENKNNSRFPFLSVQENKKSEREVEQVKLKSLLLLDHSNVPVVYNNKDKNKINPSSSITTTTKDDDAPRLLFLLINLWEQLQHILDRLKIQTLSETVYRGPNSNVALKLIYKDFHYTLRGQYAKPEDILTLLPLSLEVNIIKSISIYVHHIDSIQFLKLKNDFALQQHHLISSIKNNGLLLNKNNNNKDDRSTNVYQFWANTLELLFVSKSKYISGANQQLFHELTKEKNSVIVNMFFVLLRLQFQNSSELRCPSLQIRLFFIGLLLELTSFETLTFLTSKRQSSTNIIATTNESFYLSLMTNATALLLECIKNPFCLLRSVIDNIDIMISKQRDQHKLSKILTLTTRKIKKCISSLNSSSSSISNPNSNNKKTLYTTTTTTTHIPIKNRFNVFPLLPQDSSSDDDDILSSSSPLSTRKGQLQQESSSLYQNEFLNIILNESDKYGVAQKAILNILSFVKTEVKEKIMVSTIPEVILSEKIDTCIEENNETLKEKENNTEIDNHNNITTTTTTLHNKDKKTHHLSKNTSQTKIYCASYLIHLFNYLFQIQPDISNNNTTISSFKNKDHCLSLNHLILNEILLKRQVLDGQTYWLQDFVQFAAHLVSINVFDIACNALNTIRNAITLLESELTKDYLFNNDIKLCLIELIKAISIEIKNQFLSFENNNQPIMTSLLYKSDDLQKSIIILGHQLLSTLSTMFTKLSIKPKIEEYCFLLDFNWFQIFYDESNPFLIDSTSIFSFNLILKSPVLPLTYKLHYIQQVLTFLNECKDHHKHKLKMICKNHFEQLCHIIMMNPEKKHYDLRQLTPLILIS